MDRLMSMRVFSRVIDEGSFAAAARALDMSPAVVTRLVADLEAHLGTRLLQRSTRHLALTDAGEAYLGRVRGILQDIDEAHQLVSSHTQQLAGELHVLAPPLLVSHVLSPLVAGFLLRYPKIMLDIDVADHRNPPVEDYDVTLLITGEGFDGNVIARKIISSDVILVASPGYLARQGKPTHPDELARHNTLQLTHPDVPRQLLHLTSNNPNEGAVEVAVTPALSVNYSDALLHAALHGAGITPAAPEVVARYLANGELVHVLPGWSAGRFTMYAAMPSRKFLPRRTEVFLDYLLEHTRELAAALRLNT